MKAKRTIEMKDAQAESPREGTKHATTGPTLTTADGAPIGAQHALTAGPRGPLLAQDTALLEQLQHLNRERIPERVVHAKGAGAYGQFTVTGAIARYSRARLFGEVGRRTDVFVRFSNAMGERGSADAERDVHGFAVKFYTDEGNWDLVGSNTPVFFVRDPYRFAGLVHAQKRNPQTNLHDPNMQWDFYSQCPETLHQLTILFGDRGCPADYRHMHGYGGHTYSLVDGKGARIWCKFHLKTRQGIRNLTDAEAQRTIGEDRDSAQRDLFEAIARGEFPRWSVCIQVMTEEQSRSFRWNPFDLTKVWPHAEFPLIEIGELELNRNPQNHFAEVEQAAFKPSAMVPGIGPSPDRMLQARLMAYADAQFHRLGPNPQQVPVNAPRCPVANFLRDGAGARGSYGGLPNYWPNSVAGTPHQDASFTDPAWRLGETIAARYDSTIDQDDFAQAGLLFRKLDGGQRKRLAARIAESLGKARKEIQMRQLVHFHRASEEYAALVAAELGIDARQLLAAAESMTPARRAELAATR